MESSTTAPTALAVPRPLSQGCDERDPTPDAKPATPAPPAFTKLDEQIREMQRRPGKYVYTGNVVDVLGDGKGKKGAFQLDVEEATRFGRLLQKEVVEGSDSPEWAVVAQTRDAEMFERLRDGLASTSVHLGPGPAPMGSVSLLTPNQVRLLAQMKVSLHAGVAAKADELEDAVVSFWNQKKTQEIDDANERIVDRYARAAASADPKNPAATRAVRRLAHYTAVLGDPKMAKILGPDYVPDMYRASCARLDAAP